jgi:hypothetical protein
MKPSPAAYAIAISELSDKFQDNPCSSCGEELDQHIIQAGENGHPVAACYGVTRFADFYQAHYGNTGSGARALIVETDEPMQIRPLGDRIVVIARA